MKTLTAYQSEQEPMGFFRIFVDPLGDEGPQEITLFRGAPVKINNVTTQDPFTDQTAQLSFSMITAFDTPGQGDLSWLLPDTNVDLVWENVGGYDFEWRWEGYIASYGFSLSGSESTCTVDLKGAFYGLDDYLAMPTSPRRPIPYEILIADDFDQDKHPASLGKFRVAFPEDWTKTVPELSDAGYLAELKPWGVATGMLWTGLTSRSTGSWEPLLTGHIQSLLTVMFDEGGSQWSIRNRGSRRPELYLRRIPDSADENIIEIQLGAPGVSMNASRDYTQRAGVIYGQGSDNAGVSYSNMQISPDGSTTFFKPFAYSPRLWPRKNNPNYTKALKGKEVMIRFQDGVDEVSAMLIAQSQFQRFAEPGLTGSVTLTTDPRLANGALMPRLLIRGGVTIRLNGLLGVREGVLAHVTEVTSDFTGLTTTLTFDTKYRDQLTVAEVQARTRDALTPLRALQVGKYTNTIQDLVIPWSYKAGSGIIPKGATEFFNQKIKDQTATFPYEEWTTKYPPSKFPSYYIKIGPTDTRDSNNNWSAMSRKGIQTAAIPFRMSQAGSIRKTQLAAYDKDGHVLPVKFHMSIYSGDSTAVNSMPEFPFEGDDPREPKYLAARRVDGSIIETHYGTWTTSTDEHAKGAQTNPFYKGGWEDFQPDGSHFPWVGKGDIQKPNTGSEFIVGYGHYYEPAGYSPGLSSKGADRTGLLNDEQSWSWDLNATTDLDKPRRNRLDEYAGMLFVMIYCDDQDTSPVYFMGRLFRVEPGQS